MAKFTKPETTALQGMFASCLDVDAIDELLLTAIGLALEDITAPAARPLLVAKCIRFLEKNETHCIDVAKELCLRFPDNEHLDAVKLLLKRLQRVVVVDPRDIILVDIKVMVNRSQLRNVLYENVVLGHPRPVVGVSGVRQSGRTHSWHMIRQVANTHGIDRVWLDLTAWPDQDRRLEKLVQGLIEQANITGFEAPSSVGVTPEIKGQRYARAIAERLALRPAGERLWLVFDSVDRPIDPSIVPFLRALCDAACDSVFQGCTIFILGWGPDFALTKPALVEVEQLSDFLPIELKTAAEQINGLGDNPLDPDTLQQRVDAIHAAVQDGAWPNSIPEVERLLISLSRELRVL